LAEDHPTNQQCGRPDAGRRPPTWSSSKTAQVALEAFADHPFDVILMDTQMPVMDGLAAIAAIRDQERRRGLIRTPIISLTANAMPHQVQACLTAGADLHLAKPISIQRLFESIDAAVDLASGEAAS
jgi:CheY-like chemotaxis protein